MLCKKITLDRRKEVDTFRQGRAMRQWAERRRHDILPVTYYHVVFTLPHELNGWIQLHPEVIHRLLFHSAWGTLEAFGRDPKRLNGQMGMTAVLHTWGQNLSQHVHLHCLVPGGALGDDGRWRSARSHYLFPVRALSRHFRGRMVRALRTAADAGALHRVTQTPHCQDSCVCRSNAAAVGRKLAGQHEKLPKRWRKALRSLPAGAGFKPPSSGIG